MRHGLSQPLLPSRSTQEKITDFTTALSAFPFEAPLKTALANKIGATSNNDPILEDETVAQAMNILASRNYFFLTGTLRAWYQTPHEFSVFQKFLLFISTLTLMTAAVIARDAIILLTKGKPNLERTGSNMADYGTGGLTDTVVTICSMLTEGMTAVFNLNGDNTNLPNYLGPVTNTFNGPVPATALQTIPTWIVEPIGWIDFFTCTLQNNVTEMVGHAYFGPLKTALAKAAHAFPVTTSNIPSNPDPILNFISLDVFINLFMASFGIKLQNGGYSNFSGPDGYPYGHFDGFEDGVKQFEQNAYAFAGVFSGIAGVALLITLFLGAKKACEKWAASHEARQEFHAVKQICTLFKTLKKEVADDAIRQARTGIV